jgi:predicted DNA-binding helix-hairpin-helix protein
MARLRVHIDDAKGAARDAGRSTIVSLPQSRKVQRSAPPRFAPAGQSTQMIVGADATSDQAILSTAASLYGAYQLRRVYYSAFSPIPDASARLPLRQPPLVREHRLYQADWLIRFYGFAHDEIVPNSAAGGGMLALDIDPKLAWALVHRGQFPVDLNRAPREMLLRVPGLGVKAVDRIVQARRVRQLRADDLLRLHVPLKKVLPFVLLADHQPGASLDAAGLAAQLRPAPVQAGLFDEPDAPLAAALPFSASPPAPLAPAGSASVPTAAAQLPLPPLKADPRGAGTERNTAWV